MPGFHAVLPLRDVRISREKSASADGMKPRTNRVRCPTLAIELTERDGQILMFIGVARYVTSRQVALEFFPSEDRANQRIRKLRDARYIAVTIAGPHQPQVLSLTAKGVQVVAEVDAGLAERLRLPGTLRAAGLDHHFGIIDVRMYLAKLAAAKVQRVLCWSNAGGELHQEAGLSHLKLVPDALVDVEHRDGVLRLAVEFDSGGEVLDVILRKAARYARARDEGLVDEVWFVAGGQHQRLANVAAMLARGGVGDGARLFPHAHVLARPVADPPPMVGEQDWASGPNSMFAFTCNMPSDMAKSGVRVSSSLIGDSDSPRGTPR